MLENFFDLNGNPKKVQSERKFKRIVSREKSIKNIVYLPDILSNDKKNKFQKYKIEGKTFINVSFSKTKLKNIDFRQCHFECCLFMGTKVQNCKFLQCTFENVNTHQIEIKQTYINPKSFKKNYDKKDINKSNLAVHLFQQLLDNSRNQGQSEFARISNYYFKIWKGRLARSKFFNEEPYKINCCEFFVEFVPNFLFRWFFGYGLRLRSFIATFLITSVAFYFINLFFWSNYGFHEKDFSIASFNPDSISPVANIFFTADALTQLVDSQFQPQTDFGMVMLTFQGFIGFILLSFLITHLINRFVK